jgi:hypothetical protein
MPDERTEALQSHLCVLIAHFIKRQVVHQGIMTSARFPEHSDDGSGSVPVFGLAE